MWAYVLLIWPPVIGQEIRTDTGCSDVPVRWVERTVWREDNTHISGQYTAPQDLLWIIDPLQRASTYVFCSNSKCFVPKTVVQSRNGDNSNFSSAAPHTTPTPGTGTWFVFPSTLVPSVFVPTTGVQSETGLIPNFQRTINLPGMFLSTLIPSVFVPTTGVQSGRGLIPNFYCLRHWCTINLPVCFLL